MGGTEVDAYWDGFGVEYSICYCAVIVRVLVRTRLGVTVLDSWRERGESGMGTQTISCSLKYSKIGNPSA